MALKAFIKDLSEVSEELQAEYKKADGGFVLSVDSVDGYALENISGLRTTLEKKDATIEEQKSIIKSFGDLDPKDVLRKLNRYDKIKDMNPEQLAKEKVKQALADKENEMNKHIEKLQGTIDMRDAALKKSALDSIYSKIKEEGGRPKFVEGLIERSTKVDIDEHGNASIYFLNQDGAKRTEIENGQVRDFNTNDFIKELKNDTEWGIMFETGAKSGGGGGKGYQNRGGSQGPKIITSDQMNDNLEGLADGSVIVQD